MPAERGVLYVATGEERDTEVFTSVHSLRIHHPGLPVALFTDLHVRDDDFDDVSVIENARRDWGDKVAPLLHSPYDRTIFLATDTYVCGSLDPIFRLLDRFEMAVSHDTARDESDSSTDVPPTFPRFDTGVLAYRRTEPVLAVLEAWTARSDAISEQFASEQHLPHQQAFRELVWEHDVRVAVLPPEYNLRVSAPAAVGSHANATILRGRADQLERAARLVNQSSDARAVLPTLEHLNPAHTVILSRRGHGVVRVLGWISHLFGRRSRED